MGGYPMKNLCRGLLVALVMAAAAAAWARPPSGAKDFREEWAQTPQASDLKDAPADVEASGSGSIPAKIGFGIALAGSVAALAYLRKRAR